MNMKNLASHYPQLTPEERFRLIRAAIDRGDEVEHDRLKKAGKPITLSMADTSPYGHAMQELIFLTYIELLDTAAFYCDCNDRFHDQLRDSIGTATDADNDTVETTAEDGVANDPPWHRAGELAYAAGFHLKAKVAGWKVFCERWNDAPFAAVEAAHLPGLDRLKRAVALAEAGAAFQTPSDMVRWINSIRPAGTPEAIEASLVSAERFADDLDATFRVRVHWWGG
jgi:hypothetical protein